MTIQINSFIPFSDHQDIKKAIVLEVFLVYLVFLAIISLGTIKRKFKENSPKKLVDSEPIPLPAPSEEEQEEQVSYHPKKNKQQQPSFVPINYYVIHEYIFSFQKYQDVYLPPPLPHPTVTLGALPLWERIDYELFDRFFYPYYGFHTISVGTVLLYSPFTFSLAVVWIHYLFFLSMLLFKHAFGSQYKAITLGFYAVCQILNITLIIASIVSLITKN